MQIVIGKTHGIVASERAAAVRSWLLVEGKEAAKVVNGRSIMAIEECTSPVASAVTFASYFPFDRRYVIAVSTLIVSFRLPLVPG